jgi:NAD(P)-dependent dehydrogenase (short-subunit alcohol dehydrogenase family)
VDFAEVTDQFRLDGATAIVTGASSGFGDRFTRVLSAAGATVVAAARRSDRLEALAADVARVVPVTVDVSRDEDLALLVDTAMEHTGRIDVVVNNAGISDSPASAESEDPGLFRSVVEVNLNACFVLASLAAPTMIERGSGSVINIASIHGLVGAAPMNQAAYAASKGGLVNLTRELALQWARYRIRVNALAPAYFETELTAPLLEGEASGLNWITRNTPLRRMGHAHELDGALLLLASSAGAFITGATLAVDGGWTAR